MRKMIIPVVVLSVLLSACWDLTESEKLGLVTLIGIDSVNDDLVKVVVQEMSRQRKSSQSQNGDAGKIPAKLHEAEASTISEAVQKITASDYRRTYFSHANAIILSEELVRSRGLRPFIDFFERMPEIRGNTWLLISMKGQFDKYSAPVRLSNPVRIQAKSLRRSSQTSLKIHF